MLLEAGLVGKLPGTVGALERPLRPVVRRLQVIVEEALLGEVLVAVVAHEWSFPSVHTVVDVEMGLAGVGLLADAAYERLFA